MLVGGVPASCAQARVSPSGGFPGLFLVGEEWYLSERPVVSREAPQAVRRAAIQVRDRRRKDRERARRIVLADVHQRFLTLRASVDERHGRYAYRGRDGVTDRLGGLVPKCWRHCVPSDGAEEVGLCHLVTVDQVFTDCVNDAAWLDWDAARRTRVAQRTHF